MLEIISHDPDRDIVASADQLALLGFGNVQTGSISLNELRAKS
jgi:hypothetical protein